MREHRRTQRRDKDESEAARKTEAPRRARREGPTCKYARAPETLKMSSRQPARGGSPQWRRG